MPNEDQNIKEFFEQLKQEEAKTPVPEMKNLLPKEPAYKRKVFWFGGIAASIAIILMVWNDETNRVEDNQTANISIDIKVEPETTTNSLVQQEGNLEQWESPTDYLLTSF